MSTPIPTVNVNLEPCWGVCSAAKRRTPHDHVSGCPGTPVLVPLPLEPWRSVTMTVRLGECRCREPGNKPYGSDHWSGCKGASIRITCSIRGKTWAESEVLYVEDADRRGGLFSNVNPDAILAACRDRWAGIVNLVTGKMDATTDEHWLPLVTKRDAVYAALAKVARMERAIFEAQGEYTSAMDEHHHPEWHRDPESYVMPSQKMLALFFGRIIEQVGDM